VIVLGRVFTRQRSIRRSRTFSIMPVLVKRFSGCRVEWESFTFAAAAALVVAVLVLPWTPWPVGQLGHAPWWVWGPLVAAVLLLLVGVGERKYTAWATAVGAAAVVAGAASFLNWPRDYVVLDGRSHDLIRAEPWISDVPPEWWLRLYPAEPPVAPLACALAAAAVVVLCVVLLVRRPGPAQPGSRLPAGGPADPIRRARRVMAAVLVGVLVGGVLGVGTAHGAGVLQRERVEALGPWWGPLAESAPVPEDRLHDGAVEVDEDHEDDSVQRLPQRPTRVAWQHDFAGPGALSTCVSDGRARATLVALEESGERSVILGHDARDGAARWSLTVHRQGTAQLTQVAVGEGCSVLVLIGAVLLAIDTYSGRVTGGSVLRPAGLAAWHFMTSAPTDHPLPRLVGLRESDYAYLTGPLEGIYAVRRSDGVLVAATGRTSGGCDHLAEYNAGKQQIFDYLLLEPCSERAAVAQIPMLATPEELRAEPPPAYRRPHLQPLLASSETPVLPPPPGCTSGRLRIRAASVYALVETDMDCAGRKHRARIELGGLGRARTPAWTISPEADVAPDLTFVRSQGVADLLEVWGDAVRTLYGDDFEPRWSVVPQPGDPVVGLADVDVVRGFGGDLTGDADLYLPILALTRSGALVALAESYASDAPEKVRVIATSDVARQPCSGERGLLADKASGTALVLCTADGRTHVTAVTE
jgi:hypothetical protein